jgi:hypothetical protein
MSASVVSDFTSDPLGGLPIVSLSRGELVDEQISDPIVAHAREFILSTYSAKE